MNLDSLGATEYLGAARGQILCSSEAFENACIGQKPL